MHRAVRRVLLALFTLALIQTLQHTSAAPRADERTAAGPAMLPGGLPTATPEQVGMSSERLARIGPVMQRYIDQKLVPGTVTLIARRGRVIHFESRGLRDVGNKLPMTNDTMFRIASMTKPITSVALMMLWEEGKFQLKDPVAKYLPEFADMNVSTTADASGQTGELIPAAAPIDVRQMLTHTAGLANNYIGNTEFYREAMKSPDDKDNLERYTKRLAALPLNYQPGTAWQYSGATDVVGRLIEVLSGQPLDRFLRERLLDPLGMADTHFFLNDAQSERLAAQYTPGNDGRIELDDSGGKDSRWVKGPKALFRGAGGLVSTSRDYLRFAQAMLNGGELDGTRVLSPQTVSLMFANHTGDLPLWLAGPGVGFGLGFSVVTDRGEAATALSEGSASWGGAYCTIFWIDPQQQLIGVLMTQVRPYTHINIRQDFQVLVNQAIVD